MQPTYGLQKDIKEVNEMSQKYVVINSDGTNAFYDSVINEAIPSGALEIADSDYKKFFENQGSYVFIVTITDSITTATLSEVTVTLAEAQTAAIASLKTQAAEQYVAGVTSSATGTALYYDSDTTTQSQITAASLLAVASSTQFATLYPSGITIRAKASSSADDSTKQQYAHTADQIITLSTNMQTMLATVKTKLWAYQEKVYAATTAAEVETIMSAVKW